MAVQAKIRIAIIGVGRMGGKHFSALQANDNFDITAIIDLHAQAVNLPNSDKILKFQDYRQLNKDIADAVVIATPSRLHRQIGIYCLRAGLHVLMEKPMAINLEDCQQLLEVAETHNCASLVGQIERFNPAFIAAQTFLEKHAILPSHYASERFNPANYIQDSDVILDLLVHDLDIIMALSGSDVEDIEIIDAQLGAYGYDCIDIRLGFANGTAATLAAARGRHAEIKMKGDIQKRYLHCQWSNASMGVNFLTREAVIFATDKVLSPPTPADALQSEHYQFYRNITTQETILDFADNLTTMQVLFAIGDKAKSH